MHDWLCWCGFRYSPFHATTNKGKQDLIQSVSAPLLLHVPYPNLFSLILTVLSLLTPQTAGSYLTQHKPWFMLMIITYLPIPRQEQECSDLCAVLHADHRLLYLRGHSILRRIRGKVFPTQPSSSLPVCSTWIQPEGQLQLR